MDKQKEISKKVNLSKDTIESIILDPQKRMMLTSQYQTMLVDLFKAHKACEGSSDTEKEEIQKTIHNIESYLYKEREFTQLWKDLQSEKGLLSEYQTHAPHMNSIDISNEDRKEFEVIREKNLNEHR